MPEEPLILVEVKLPEGLTTFLTGGVALVVATRSSALVPELSRAWGTEVAPDGASLTLCVGAPTGSTTRANLHLGSPIAATFSSPSTYRTVQIKGDIQAVRKPTPEQVLRVNTHVAAFCIEVAPFGVPPANVRRWVDLDLLAVTFVAREVFDQTPGQHAGEPL